MKRGGQHCGYILIELIIALGIFATAVLGLASSLNLSLEIINTMNRENAIRISLRSFLEEARRKSVADMATSTTDERLGCTLTSTLEPAGLQNRDGKTLSDLYKLTATATYSEGSEQKEESVMVYVYQPEQ